MECKMIMDYIEKKLQAGQYRNMAAEGFTCRIWVKRNTELYAVCIFDQVEPFEKDAFLLDRIMGYVTRQLRDQFQLPCYTIALILSDDFAVSKKLLTGAYPRWFIDGEGKPVIFDGQPSRFGGLETVLTAKVTPWNRIRQNLPEKLPWVTIVIVLMNVLVQIIVALQERFLGESELMRVMVLEIGRYLRKPEWWRLITSVFLHFGWEHLFNNMLVMLYLGSMAERCVGKGRFLVSYLLSGIGANIISVWWYARQGELMVATAGASGAIFGVAGLLLCIVVFSRGKFAGLTLRQLVMMMLFTLYHGLAESGVNNCAHVAGSIIGFLSGFVIFLWVHCREGQR